MEKDSYGYEINKSVQEKTDNQYELKEYPLFSIPSLSNPDILYHIGETRQLEPEDDIIQLHPKEELII